jgi:hypothetical protein
MKKCISIRALGSISERGKECRTTHITIIDDIDVRLSSFIVDNITDQSTPPPRLCHSSCPIASASSCRRQATNWYYPNWKNMCVNVIRVLCDTRCRFDNSIFVFRNCLSWFYDKVDNFLFFDEGKIRQFSANCLTFHSNTFAVSSKINF